MEYDCFMLGHGSESSDNNEALDGHADVSEMTILGWINLYTRQRFTFFYDDASAHLMEPLLRRCADDPELQFSRVDAALLSAHLRKQQEDAEIISGEGFDPKKIFDELLVDSVVLKQQ
jgi:hypothetical protein